jgi:hypothetical protein
MAHLSDHGVFDLVRRHADTGDGERAQQPVDLVDDDDVNAPGLDVAQRCSPGRSMLAPEKPSSS